MGFDHMSGATLTIKCLKCKSCYDQRNVAVHIDAIIDEDAMDEDAFVFVQYDVTFTKDGAPVYIEDLLCLPKRCSVFGRLPNGAMFAFPCLTAGPRGSVWHSRPDSKGSHFAIKQPAR